MPTAYICDHCHATSNTFDNWLIVSVTYLHDNPNAPKPPGGRTLDASLPDYVFDKVECRDAWIAERGLADAVPIVQPKIGP